MYQGFAKGSSRRLSLSHAPAVPSGLLGHAIPGLGQLAPEAEPLAEPSFAWVSLKTGSFSSHPTNGSEGCPQMCRRLPQKSRGPLSTAPVSRWQEEHNVTVCLLPQKGGAGMFHAPRPLTTSATWQAPRFWSWYNLHEVIIAVDPCELPRNSR